MREVSVDMLAAIKNSDQRIVAKAKIDPSRTFFPGLTSDEPYDSGDYAETTDAPWGQCMLYSPTYDLAYTFVVDSTSGSIYGMEEGDATKNDLSLTADPDTKPTAWAMGNGTALLWWWDDTDVLKQILVNLAAMSTSQETTIAIDQLPAEWTVTAGSPHALSATQIAFTYQTSLGGIGVGYYDGAWQHWNQRFMSPSGLTALDWTIYSTAVIFENRVFVYCTDMHEGYVRGTKLDPYKSVWSDSFEAMPADLSRFCILNAIVANGFIHIAGQFHRTEDWSNAKIYSLVVRSLDGYTFSWDRFTLLSDLGYQFQIALKTGAGQNYLYASDRNSVGVVAASYFFVSVPNDRVTLGPPNDLVSASIDSPMSASLMISVADEIYLDEATIQNNNRVILYLGYEVQNKDYEYVEYQRYIIAKRGVSRSDENKTLNIALVDMATWKTSQIAFPFYAEILSKTSFRDDCDAFDHTYPVNTVSPYMPDFLLLDFWSNTKWDGDGVVTGGEETQFRSGSSRVGCAFLTTTCYQGDTDKQKFRTIELDEFILLDDHPTIQESGDFDLKLYGWDTSAIMDLTDGETSTPARPNHTWRCYVVTADPNDHDDRTVTEGALTSSYALFPQEYPDDEAAILLNGLLPAWQKMMLFSGLGLPSRMMWQVLPL